MPWHIYKCYVFLWNKTSYLHCIYFNDRSSIHNQLHFNNIYFGETSAVYLCPCICLNMWHLSAQFELNLFWQWTHLYGWSPVWRRLWTCMFCFVLNDLLQMSQTKALEVDMRSGIKISKINILLLVLQKHKSKKQKKPKKHGNTTKNKQ